ncbi:MAG: cupin domain-containing protein, partial [Solirubrobacteraceae bacterium]
PGHCIEMEDPLAQIASGSGIRMYLYDVDPGTSSCPYHYEYVDEWLLVVSGSVAVRTPDGERTLATGALVRFPAGPEGAHKIMNRTDAPARTLLLSIDHGPAVSVYPDSNKVGV